MISRPAIRWKQKRKLIFRSILVEKSVRMIDRTFSSSPFDDRSNSSVFLINSSISLCGLRQGAFSLSLAQWNRSRRHPHPSFVSCLSFKTSSPIDATVADMSSIHFQMKIDRSINRYWSTHIEFLLSSSSSILSFLLIMKNKERKAELKSTQPSLLNIFAFPSSFFSLVCLFCCSTEATFCHWYVPQ